MPQSDAPKVMPDLGCLSIHDVGYYIEFFKRTEAILASLQSFDPACAPVLVISPAMSPAIELTGLQWPSEQLMVGEALPIQIDFSKFPHPPVQNDPAPVAMVKIDDDRLRGAMIDKEPMGAAAPVAVPEPSALASSPAADAPAAGAVAPSQTQARAPAAGTKPAKWTEAEDAALITIMAEEMAKGASRRMAAEFAATKINRPIEGLYWRTKHLTKAINKAIAALFDAPKDNPKTPAPEQTDPPAAVQVVTGDSDPKAADVAAPRASGRAGAGEPEAPAPVETMAKPTSARNYVAAMEWLQRLAADDATKAKPLSTPETDYVIMQLHSTGLPAQQIAFETDLAEGAVKLRIIALTQAKTHAPVDLLAAMRMLHPELVNVTA